MSDDPIQDVQDTYAIREPGHCRSCRAPEAASWSKKGSR